MAKFMLTTGQVVDIPEGQTPPAGALDVSKILNQAQPPAPVQPKFDTSVPNIPVPSLKAPQLTPPPLPPTQIPAAPTPPAGLGQLNKDGTIIPPTPKDYGKQFQQIQQQRSDIIKEQMLERETLQLQLEAQKRQEQQRQQEFLKGRDTFESVKLTNTEREDKTWSELSDQHRILQDNQNTFDMLVRWNQEQGGGLEQDIKNKQKDINYVQQQISQLENRFQIEKITDSKETVIRPVHIPGIEDIQADLFKQRQQIQSQEVDPNKYYNNMGTWQTVGMAIASAMYAAGQALTGNVGANAPLQILNRAIENDITSQKFNIQQAKEKYNLTADDLKNKILMNQIKVAEEEKQRAQIISDANFRVDNIMAKGVRQDLQQQALQFKMTLDKAEEQAVKDAWQAQMQAWNMKLETSKIQSGEAREQAKLGFEAQKWSAGQQFEAQKFAAEKQFRAAETKAGLEAGLKKEVISKMGEIGVVPDIQVTGQTPPTSLSKEQRERFVVGEGLALDKDMAKQFRGSKVDLDVVKAGLNELKAMANKSYTNPVEFMKDRAKAENLAASLKGKMRIALVGPGAMSDMEQKLLTDAIANPMNIFSIDKLNLQRLDTLTGIIDKQYDAYREQAGLKTPTTQPKQFDWSAFKRK